MMVETTTHARAWIAIQAMQAGMDAYIEKPMCLTIAEGRHMVKAAAQVQARHPGRHAAALDADQQLGQRPGEERRRSARSRPCWPRTSSARSAGPRPRRKDVKRPVEPWWDIWTNQAELRPYDPEIHYGWATWWDYDGGGLCFGVTGWGTHSYDQINRALGTDDTGPVEVLLEEPVADRDTGKFVAAEDGRRRGDRRHGRRRHRAPTTTAWPSSPARGPR